jgi:hypothetical protein
MKHCPECEFTFDDQQEVCDFDGTKLLIVPERPPAFKSVSFAPPPFVRRLVASRGGLATLALVGVALSALLIGYYDSVSQPEITMPPSQTHNAAASTAEQVETQADRPRSISTQRRIGADELPSSMVERLTDGSRSRSNKSQRGPSTPKLAVNQRKSANSSVKLAASRRKSANPNRQSQARNQTRPGSRERVRQQHSTVNITSRRTGWRASESAHHRKDPKVISILKKTGSVLKKPFELIF